MRTDAGVSHADHWQAAHHRHHGYLHHRHRGYHGYPPEADQQLVHPPPPLCVGVKGGLEKHTRFTTFFYTLPSIRDISEKCRGCCNHYHCHPEILQWFTASLALSS